MRLKKYGVFAVAIVIAVFILSAFALGRSIPVDKCNTSVSITEITTIDGKIINTIRTYCSEMRKVSLNA